jgi:hypothetical protein
LYLRSAKPSKYFVDIFPTAGILTLIALPGNAKMSRFALLGIDY